jgi:hypothetical protein
MDWVGVREGGGVIVSSAVAWRLRRGLGIFAVVEGVSEVRRGGSLWRINILDGDAALGTLMGRAVAKSWHRRDFRDSFRWQCLLLLSFGLCFLVLVINWQLYIRL